MRTAIASDPTNPQDNLSTRPNPGVLRIRHFIVNSYLVGEPGTGPWALVDAGLAPFCAAAIISAAVRRFGRGTAPEAIILTHGHFDHIGALRPLLKQWDVPVYAHPLELPYLTGRSSYPPPDPTVGGGAMARLSKLFPSKPIDLTGQVQALPPDGEVPGMPGWRWIHTPGHAPGHISLFRFADRMLIAGDAFVTTRQESFLSVVTQHQQVSRPPAYFTPDWDLAEQSLRTLLHMDPELGATGHGVPMAGERLKAGLRALVENFWGEAVPKHGRYVSRPASTDETGVVSLPPEPRDLFPKALGLGLAGLAVVILAAAISRPRRKAR